MIKVDDNDKGHDQTVTVRSGNVSVVINECHSTGRVMVDVYEGGLPLVSYFSAQVGKYMAIYKNACSHHMVEREVK